MYQDSLSFVRTIQPAFVPVNRPFALQSLERHKGVALVVGGGARVAVTSHLSVRPDVTVYAGNQWTHVRVSVGAGLGW